MYNHSWEISLYTSDNWWDLRLYDEVTNTLFVWIDKGLLKTRYSLGATNPEPYPKKRGSDYVRN